MVDSFIYIIVIVVMFVDVEIIGAAVQYWMMREIQNIYRISQWGYIDKNDKVTNTIFHRNVTISRIISF
jgi:hypothetical protein